jgi:uncharacterized protein (DUF1501 family)
VNPTDTALEARAAQVQCELAAQDEAWRTSGWTRRRFLAGAGMAGVAALGSQLVSVRASYGATADRTLIVVFLRGAADGLRILVPASSALGLPYLQATRPQLVPPVSTLLPLGNTGFGLNANLAPLYNELWGTGELAFVPAVASAGISHSHFQAQQFLENGGSDTAGSGWLDRVLTQLGPGTTFRAVAEGSTSPTSLAGTERSLNVDTLGEFTFPASGSSQLPSEQAILALYRGVDGPLGEDVPDTLSALATAAQIRKIAPATNYPSGSFAASLRDLAAILKAEVGLQVATVDVGGWDTHTDEANQLDNQLAAAAAALRAFMVDLGRDRRSRVTVVLMTEFGRRVAMNASGGTDHGHGGVMWLLGGGLAGSGVYGKWSQLSAAALVNGDVPGWNSPFDVLGELVQKRLGVGSLSQVFPGYSLSSLGVARTS